MSEERSYREALAAYALHALPEDEVPGLLAHLEGCADCRAELEAHCEVRNAMAVALPRHVAPPALRDRVMRTVRAEAELLRAAGPEADRAPAPASRRRRWRLGPLDFGPLGGLVAGAVVAIVAVLGFALGSGGGGSSPAGPPARTVRAQILQGAGPRASGRIEERGKEATLHVAGFRPAGPGRVYQVWLKPAPKAALRPTGVLFTVGKDGRAAAELPAAARRAYRVLVSSELAGGSPSGQPTRPPVLQSAL